MSDVVNYAVAIDISATDHTKLPSGTIGFYVGTSAGATIIVHLRHSAPGVNFTFKNVIPGYCYPMAIDAVIKTGTTAADIVALVSTDTNS